MEILQQQLQSGGGGGGGDRENSEDNRHQMVAVRVLDLENPLEVRSYRRLLLVQPRAFTKIRQMKV